MRHLVRKNWMKSAPARWVLVLFFVGSLVWGTLVGAQQEIIIKVDGKAVHHQTLQRKLEAALAEAGVKLGAYDVVEPDLTAPVRDGLRVTVLRAVPVRVVAEGRVRIVLTPPTPVQEVLDLANIELGPQDQVNLPLQDIAQRNTVIKVIRISEEISTEKYFLPIPVERHPDPCLERGRIRVVRAGEAGQGERSVKITYADGKEIKRTVIGERILRPSLSRIIAYGAMGVVARGGTVVRFRSCLEVEATAYSSAVGRYTATGYAARHGVVAVDPQVIPLGSRLYVEGYGYATALDVGSSIKGNRIDVFFESEEACRGWGRRWAKVYVLE